MDDRQAIEIQKHAFGILEAVAEIESIVSRVGENERVRLAPHLGDMIVAVRFGILESLYAQFPDLRLGDKEEQPEVSSVLKWSDVILPESVTAADLDRTILFALKQSWLKTARVIGDVVQAFGQRSIELEADVVGSRIVVLVEAGRIEAAGNPVMWRHSEVRLASA